MTHHLQITCIKITPLILFLSKCTRQAHNQKLALESGFRHFSNDARGTAGPQSPHNRCSVSMFAKRGIYITSTEIQGGKRVGCDNGIFSQQVRDWVILGHFLYLSHWDGSLTPLLLPHLCLTLLRVPLYLDIHTLSLVIITLTLPTNSSKKEKKNMHKYCFQMWFSKNKKKDLPTYYYFLEENILSSAPYFCKFPICSASFTSNISFTKSITNII